MGLLESGEKESGKRILAGRGTEKDARAVLNEEIRRRERKDDGKKLSPAERELILKHYGDVFGKE